MGNSMMFDKHKIVEAISFLVDNMYVRCGQALVSDNWHPDRNQRCGIPGEFLLLLCTQVRISTTNGS